VGLEEDGGENNLPKEKGVQLSEDK